MEQVYSAPAVGDTISMDVIVRPPWWAFWRKPTRARRQFVVTRTITPAPRDDFDEYPNVTQVRSL